MAASLRIPAALQHDADEIFKLTDAFCVEHLISVNGLIVDARTLPAEIQAEARRRGLIP